MPESDTQFCVRVLRHAAIGAIIGGPIAATLAWSWAEHHAQTHQLATPVGANGGMGSLALIATAAALLIGVWLGATVGCCFGRKSGEETCYGGVTGCLVYLVGGVLGVLIGGRVLGLELSWVSLYIIGGTVMGLIALGVTLLGPGSRRRKGSG